MFAGDPTELKYVLPTFLHSSLQPHTLILSSGLENTFKPNYTPERSGLLNADLSFLHTLDVACHNGTHLLEVLPQLDNLAALRVFGTHKNQKISRLRELDAAGRFPESDYSQGRHVTEMDRTDFLYSIRVSFLAWSLFNVFLVYNRPQVTSWVYRAPRRPLALLIILTCAGPPPQVAHVGRRQVQEQKHERTRHRLCPTNQNVTPSHAP